MAEIHTLPERTSGSLYRLAVHRFAGTGGPGVYIQAGIHADEVPSMLVASRLLQRFGELEQAGALRGDVVVVPACNPIGLAQRVLGEPEGRFDLASGANFNRGFPDLSTAGAAAGEDPDGLAAAIGRALDERPAANVVEDLQHLLLRLGAGAETVLDLHCNHDGELHLFAPEPVLGPGLDLARCLGARLVVASTPDPSDTTFEDASILPALDLATRTGKPPRRFACTVELRGQRDVADALAEHDAEAILRFLGRRGTIEGGALTDAPLAPEPLVVRQDDVAKVTAPCPGILLFHAEIGDEVAAGDPVVTLVDPTDGRRTRLDAPVTGRVFSRTGTRYAVRGVVTARIAPRRRE